MVTGPTVPKLTAIGATLPTLHAGVPARPGQAGRFPAHRAPRRRNRQASDPHLREISYRSSSLLRMSGLRRLPYPLCRGRGMATRSSAARPSRADHRSVTSRHGPYLFPARRRLTKRSQNGLKRPMARPGRANVTVTNMIGLVLADDHRVFAEGLGVMLDAQEAVELAATHEPMVLLLDAHMPGADLAWTLRAVKAASPASKVLMLSADTRKETIAEALRAGADGFLAKDASSRQVAGAIRSLVEGHTGMVITAEPVARPTRDPSVDLRVRTLSVREREILGLLANGWSNRRIADECFLSLNTVRTHVQNVLVKLGVHSKLEAVAFALEHQVVGSRAQASWVTGRA